MADSMQNLDLGFPELTDGKSTEDKLIEIRDYLFILLENLRFLLHNLGLENFNSAELDALTAPVYKSISDLEGDLTELSLTAKGLGLRVSNVEEDVTTVAITAQGAAITAQNAAGQAAAVALTVDGFTVYDPNTGKKTLISGDYIRSGTISGVELVSTDANYRSYVRILQGGIRIFDSASANSPATIKMDNGVFSITGPPGAGGPSMQIINYSNKLLVAGSPLKLESAGDMSIDASGGSGIYIGTTYSNEKVTIGNGGTEIRLVGDVYINGVKQ